jgi:MFS superfamily sulfate permease-like transporter
MSPTTSRPGLMTNLRADLPASFVVFLVALPLCMGIAIASGVPPARGLITGIVGGLVVALFAGAPLQVSGPAAGLTVLVWDLVQKHGLEALGVAVLLGGVLQMAAGLLRAGRWFRAVSPAVIHGMLAGIGVLIFASQFHVMVDDSPRGTGIENLLSIPEAIYSGVFPLEGTVHHFAAAIGLLTLVSLVLWNNFKPKKLSVVPGALVAVVVASAAAFFFELPIRFVSVPDSLASEVALPSLASFGLLANPSILGAAIGLAVIASAETLLCATAVDKLHDGPRTKYDKELFAQGIGNTICGVFGALPMTGVIVRSSANVEAGGKTRASAFLHGVWLLGFVALAPFVLALVPTAALAGILVYTGYRLAHPSVFRQMWAYGRGEFFVFFATICCIVGFDLLTGVVVGLGLALARTLLRLAALRVELEPGDPQTLRLFGAATFVQLPRLAHILEALPLGTTLIVDHSSLRYIDHACLELLRSWDGLQKRAGAEGLRVDWDALEEHHHLNHLNLHDHAEALAPPSDDDVSPAIA